MKKLVLTAIAAVVLPTLVLAQGTVSFGSATGSQFFQFQNLVKAGGVQAELWWSPDNVAAYSRIATTLTGTGGAAGFIAPAITVTTATAGGGNAFFSVRGDAALWLMDVGNIGMTPGFQVTGLGNPAGTPPTPAPTLGGWTAPVTLVPVPEPSAMMLAGLGAGALLLFRRRK